MVIKCPNCSHYVRDTAEMCPNCNYRLKDDASSKEGSSLKSDTLTESITPPPFPSGGDETTHTSPETNVNQQPIPVYSNYQEIPMYDDQQTSHEINESVTSEQTEEGSNGKDKTFSALLVLGILTPIIFAGLYFFGNRETNNSQADQLVMTDSVCADSAQQIELLKQDSIKRYEEMHDPDVILERVKEMFGDDNFFSESYKSLEAECERMSKEYESLIGPDYVVWYTSQGGCGEIRTTFGTVQNITDKSATIKVYNKDECDEENIVILHLIYENDNWYVDDISDCFTKSIKAEMKKEIKEVKNSPSVSDDRNMTLEEYMMQNR